MRAGAHPRGRRHARQREAPRGSAGLSRLRGRGGHLWHAGPVGLRRLPRRACRSRARHAAGGAGHRARGPRGAREGPGRGRRRLPLQAGEPPGAPRARALAPSHQAPLRYGAEAGATARRVEPDAGGTRGRAGAPRGEARAPEALLLAAAGRVDPRGRRRRPAREPSPRHHGGVPRPARLHRLRRDRRARGGDGRALRIPPRDGAAHPRVPGHARALHGRRPHGFLQ